MPVFVFDTGPLSHFARAQRLDALKTILAGHTAVVPKSVVDELKQGLHLHKELTSVIEADWIEHRQIRPFLPWPALVANLMRRTQHLSVSHVEPQQLDRLSA